MCAGHSVDAESAILALRDVVRRVWEAEIRRERIGAEAAQN